MLNIHVNTLDVLLDNKQVGTLAETPEGTIAFQYSEDWIREGFSISPRSLPLDNQVFVANWQPFGGIFGVFHDSLPDGWGALLLDRKLKQHNIDPAAVSPLARLSIVGTEGRGALGYVPQNNLADKLPDVDLDTLAQICKNIFEDKTLDNLDSAYAAGGSSGGARPKAYYEIDGESWLVKFPSHIDPADIGHIEYCYMKRAQDCGITIPPVALLPSHNHTGYFASKRFDREGNRRIHMLTASALLEVSHRIPSLDYRSLFQLSYYLTGGYDEAKQLYRRMCFNVFAHNFDDHSNNFTWLCEAGQWHLAPAYDLTYSTTQYGGHATTLRGQANPGMQDVLALGKEVGIPAREAKLIAESIQEACMDLLADLHLSA